jgi:protocatechuate 3,4-dioxygenase beta subunit
MISDSEPGDQISISGKIMNEKTLEPLANVVIELVHADSLGHYFDEKSNWNPRLFAYLISDQKGEFRVGTIRPGLYKDDEGNYIPSHIHFTLELEKYRPYSDEFTFEDDSILRIQGNRELLPIATVKKSVKGIKQFNIVLYMQKNER